MGWSLTALLVAILVIVVLLTRTAATTRTKLEEEKRRTEGLYRFGQRLAAMSEVEALSRVILSGITELTSFEVGAVYVVSQSGRSFRRAAALGVDLESLPARLRIDGQEEVLQGREELQAVLAHGGRTLGFVALSRPGGAAGPEEIAEVERLAEQSAVALAHALALRRTRQLLDVNRAVLDSTPAGITMVDLSGRLVFSNRVMEELYASFDVPAEGPSGSG